MTAALVLPDLTALPKTGPLFGRAALTARRKGKPSSGIPANAVTLRGLRFDPKHIAAYNAVCGLPEGTFALTYPQVLAAPLHMHVLIQPNYPFPLLGMVHIANVIEQKAAIDLDARYDLRVQVGESRRVPQGIEVDLRTELLAGTEPVWSAVTTVLHRLPGKPGARKSPPPAPPATAAQYRPFSVPEDIGRRYAPVAKDYNPIHLYALTAKAFGFPRAIAHGMWSVARCLGELLPQLEQAPARLEVRFKQPLLLPSRVTLKFQARDQGFDFDLLAREGGKLHLSGRLDGSLK